MAVLAILNGHPIPPKINYMLVALIPKKSKPELIMEFGPISLCNVIYKLITKFISNWMEPIWPAIISANQVLLSIAI